MVELIGISQDVGAAATAVLADGAAGRGTYGYPGPTTKCGVTITNSGSVATSTASQGTGQNGHSIWLVGLVHRLQLRLQPVLFQSDFDSMNGLTPLMGLECHADRGFTANPLPGGRLAFGDSSWTDYSVDVTATLQSGHGYGVYYRADSNPNITGYIFQY